MRWNWQERCLGLGVIFGTLGILYLMEESADQAATRVLVGMTVAETQEAVGYPEGVSPFQIFHMSTICLTPGITLADVEAMRKRQAQERVHYRCYDLPVGGVLVLFKGPEGEEVVQSVTTIRREEEELYRSGVFKEKSIWTLENCLKDWREFQDFQDLKGFLTKRQTVLRLCLAELLGLLVAEIARRSRLRLNTVKS